MILGIVSDTHSLVLPQKLFDGLKGVDLIVHAGDLCDADVLKVFKAIAPVKAVQGNMDDATLKRKLPLKELFEAQGCKIGVCHGHGLGRDALENVKEQFKNDAVDLAVFGHSHQPFNQKIGATLYFNPGSPNDAVRAPYFSYGLIEIAKGRIKPAIVKI
ncbi:MAG: metallophosphoesterase family protein [Candidatus Omnitrophica bacterium]|nr:metallophosphoesterase family protein [Candidatus Omnitrophota bacterium]